jgi:hypothetical protein
MPMPAQRPRQIPTWLRWTALLWLALWFPVYWIYWHPSTFVHLCDVAVILTCIGLWSSNSLLLSSQAVSSLAVDLIWCFDVVYAALWGKHPIGGTEYMWDATRPLWVRMLSLFHVIWPVLLLWAIFHVGYDRRAWILQSGIAAILLAASRFFGPKENINYAFTDPFFHRAWGPAPVHVALTLAVLIGAVYLPTHWVLARCFNQHKGTNPSE